jgi:NADPH-dependent glutamate synthase beta subunit-like oxidoreductase
LRAVALSESLPLGSDVVVIGGEMSLMTLHGPSSASRLRRARGGRLEERRVRLVSLETLEEMPADTVEIREGEEEESSGSPAGVRDYSAGEQGNVVGLEIKRCLRVYDDQRRFAPVREENRQVLDCDTILIAAGQAPDLSFGEGGVDVEQFRPAGPR